MTHLKPTTVPVLLYHGDDMEQMTHLLRALDLAQRREKVAGANARAGDDSESVVAAQAAYDEFVDAAAERALDVRLQVIGREFFRDLIRAHPPRMVESEPDADGKTKMVEHAEDAGTGVNMETFPLALLTFRHVEEDPDDGTILTATIAKPDFKSQAQVTRFVNRELSDGWFDDLFTAAYEMNRSGVGNPKAFTAGSTSGSRSSDET